MAASTTVIVRAVSEARFEIARRTGTSPVVLGERDDAPLLGAVETLGLMVNPLTREVRPMGRLPMYRALGAASASRPSRRESCRAHTAAPMARRASALTQPGVA